MADKQDFLGECNTQKVTIEDFQQQFCVRCLNPECIRSRSGDSLFERRVSTWEARLFNQVPKMSMQDPRYEQIRAQKFWSIDTEAPLEVHGSWIDPRDLDKPPEAPVSVPPPSLVSAPTTTPATPAPPPAPTPTDAPTPKLKSAGLMNTPNTPKMRIGSPATPTTVPTVTPDPWVPKKKSEGERIVSPGARVRFGSGVNKG